MPYALTALVAGEMVLDIINTTTPNQVQAYVVTVMEYVECDCNVEDMVSRGGVVGEPTLIVFKYLPDGDVLVETIICVEISYKRAIFRH